MLRVFAAPPLNARRDKLHLIRRQGTVRVVVVVVVCVPVVVDIAHIVRVTRVVIARPKDTEFNLTITTIYNVNTDVDK